VKFGASTLATYLNLNPVRQQAQKLVRGQPAHLYPSDLATLQVPLVPRRVQDKVETLLDRADSRRLEAADRLREAVDAVEALVLGA
jgi:hypothetical protein